MEWVLFKVSLQFTLTWCRAGRGLMATCLTLEQHLACWRCLDYMDCSLGHDMWYRQSPLFGWIRFNGVILERLKKKRGLGV